MTFLIALLLQDDPSAAALETFKAEYRAKEASARAAAVTTLAATQHDKVYAQLGRLLTVDEKDVRIAAAKGLGGCAAEKKAWPMAYLLGSIGPNAKEPAVVAAILEALGKLKQEAALPEIEKHFRSRQIAVARAAIEAAAEIRSSRSVPALIALLKWLEDSAKEAPALDGGGNYGGKNLPGLGGGGVQDQDARERERALTPVVNKALQAITGSSMSGRQAWESGYRATGGRGRPER
jgi:HEAT repeat protein